MQGATDISLIVFGGCGLVLSVVYVVFAFLVTRQSNFYKARRWKAAVGLAVLPSVFVVVMITAVSVVSSGMTFIRDFASGGTSFLQLLGWVFEYLVYWSLCLTPFWFIVTLGTYYRLTGWMNSDDYLDKIWKDPNQGHKSPIGVDESWWSR
jgi:hypothetical protein